MDVNSSFGCMFTIALLNSISFWPLDVIRPFTLFGYVYIFVWMYIRLLSKLKLLNFPCFATQASAARLALSL